MTSRSVPDIRNHRVARNPLSKAITCAADLHALPHWVVFDQVSQPDGKKPKKIPYTPGTDREARVNDPATWGTHAEAVVDAERTGRLLGVTLTPAMNLTLLDYDGHIDDELVERFDSYSERSVNGGLHILVRGRPPEGFVAHSGIEVYPRHGNRFLVLTEDIIDGRDTIADRTELLTQLFPARPKPAPRHGTSSSLDVDDRVIVERVLRMRKGRQLHGDGDMTGHPSGSEADITLLNCYISAGATTAEQLNDLFRSSALYQARQARWDDDRYRERTLTKALNGDVRMWEGWSQQAAEGSDNARSHAEPTGDPCAAERDQLAELRAEIATLKRQLAERDATIVALTQTILNPHLTHTEKVGAVNIARHADAKRQGGQVDADGCVSLSPAEVSDDWRPKPEAGEHIAPVNPDTGTVPHMPRSSARAVLDTAIERGLLTGEKRGTVRRRADNSTFKDWEYVVSPESSFADLLNPWATWRPDQPKMRKVRESRACKHCGEVHPITRVDYCGGCGGELNRQTIEQPDAGANISPIRSVAEERNGRNICSDGADVNSEEPAWLADAPQPWESAPQPALFVMPEPPPLDHRTDVAYGARR